MPSIGELFVEIGTIGDSKELKQFVENAKEAVKQIDKQIQGNKRLLQYLKDLKEAQTQGEKALVKENFANEIKKQKMLDQIDVTEKQISGHKELAANVGKVVKGVGLFVGAVTGAAIALNKFTNDLVQSNQAILNLTRTTDIAQSTFQKWGSIGKMLGVENADQQLASLNQRLFDLMLTGEGAKGFQLAGINPVGQDAEGVLEQLRARVSGMNDTMATYLLQQMGLDPQMLHLLRMSRTEFEELGETVRKYQLTPEQSKQIQQMNIQLQIAGIRLQYLKDRAILAIMPAFTQFMASLARVAEKFVKFVKWLKDGSTWGAKLTKTILGIAAGFAAWGATTMVVAKAIGFVTIAVKALRAAFLALTAHPIIAGLTLLAGALMLIADDISHYMNGGGSVIGVIAKGLEDLNIKGFIDFPVPKWLEYLIEVIHFYQRGGFNEGVDKKNLHKDIINGDYSLLFETGDPERNAAIERLKKMQMIKQNPFLNDNAKNDAIIKLLTTPQMQQNVRNNNSSSVTNNDNKVSMTNYIQTSQPAFDIQNQLLYARNAMNSTFA